MKINSKSLFFLKYFIWLNIKSKFSISLKVLNCGRLLLLEHRLRALAIKIWRRLNHLVCDSQKLLESFFCISPESNWWKFAEVQMNFFKKWIVSEFFARNAPYFAPMVPGVVIIASWAALSFDLLTGILGAIGVPNTQYPLSFNRSKRSTRAEFTM